MSSMLTMSQNDSGKTSSACKNSVHRLDLAVVWLGRVSQRFWLRQVDVYSLFFWVGRGWWSSAWQCSGLKTASVPWHKIIKCQLFLLVSWFYWVNKPFVGLISRNTRNICQDKHTTGAPRGTGRYLVPMKRYQIGPCPTPALHCVSNQESVKWTDKNIQ